METALFLQDISSLCLITACALVFPRWLWLQFRLSNIDAFMNQIEKLVRANNTERAIKLCHAVPGEPVGLGTRAVLHAYMSGQKMNETQVIDTFHAALPGGSVRTSMSRFRTLKTISFFVAAAGVLSHFFGFSGSTVLSHFWVTTIAFIVLFGAATSKANKLEQDLFGAVGRLMKLVSEPDQDDPGVDAEEDPERGEGHLEIKQAYDDVEQSLDEIHAGGIEALLVLSFRKEHKIDLSRDETALKRLRDAAQKAAIELRHQTQTEVNLPFIFAGDSGPLHLVVNVHRKQALVFSRKHPRASGLYVTEEPQARTSAPAPELTLQDLMEAHRDAKASGRIVEISVREVMEKKRLEQAKAAWQPDPDPVPESSVSSSAFSSPPSSPLSSPPSSLPSSPLSSPPSSPAAPPAASPGKAVVCRNCAAPIPLEPEILAQIEGEFDLWTKVKTRCPQCGGSFFELKKSG